MQIWVGKVTLYLIRQRQRVKHRLKRKAWTNNNNKLIYLESGKSHSGPTLVFLHGLGASKDQWGPHVYQLSGDHHCIFIDLPGEGESSFDPSHDYSPQAQVERLREFFEDQEMKNFVLLGSSVGGCIAALYAAKYPQNVAKLITVAPAGVPSPSKSHAMLLFMKTEEHPFGYRSIPEMRYLWSLVFHHDPKVPAFLEKALAKKGKDRYHRIQKIVNDFFDAGLFPLRSALKEIRSDTLVIWGRQDKIFDVSCADFIAEELPNSDIRLLNSAGHAPYLEEGRQTVNEIRKFLLR